MTITEAARKAAKTRSCISREEWKGINMAVLPTNGTECCMLVRTKKNEGQYLVGPLWEPQREDLVAGDWRVLSLEKFPDDFQHFVKAALEAVIEVSNPMFGQ